MSEGLKPGAPVRHPRSLNQSLGPSLAEILEAHGLTVEQWMRGENVTPESDPDMAANRAALPRPPWYASGRHGIKFSSEDTFALLAKQGISCESCRISRDVSESKDCPPMYEIGRMGLVESDFFCNQWEFDPNAQ